MPITPPIRSSLTALVTLSFFASPAFAEKNGEDARETGADVETIDGLVAEVEGAVSQQGRPPQGAPGNGPPMGPPGRKPVFDETWATIGIGAGLVPSYSGSDDYVLFPLPLIVGRVGGVGITPNGPGFALNFLSEGPSRNPSKTSFSFGPSFRLRSDRDNQIGDEVVELAGELETAFEIGLEGGVNFSGVLHSVDRVSLSTQVRWDILGAHDGMLVEPGVAYFTPLGRGAAIQLAANASFVDDSFADYYYTVTPAQSIATGLPEFTADGGLNSVGALAIMTVDLNGNILDGGFNIYGVGGYSQLVGDAADTPFTAERGSAGQFIGGIGIGYTF